MPASAPTAKPFCVVADDVRANRTLVAMWLEELGYDCQTAADGGEAWKLVLEHRAELLITDIDMPVCSGLALLHALRLHDASPLQRLPVIVMSSMRDSDMRTFIDAYGGTVFLPKPLEKETFTRVVTGIDDLKSVFGDAGAVPPASNFDSVQQISPTLRRLVREVHLNGPRFG